MKKFITIILIFFLAWNSYSQGTILNSFTTVGTTKWTAPAGVTSVSVLVVAGGGSGGNHTTTNANGGGGGGGVIYYTSYSVTPGDSYTVTVGSGGARVCSTCCAVGNNGQNSVFATLTAIGGGGGGSTGCGPGQNGGSGGGAAYSYQTAGSSTQTGGFGNSGGATAVTWTGAGGGGAGSAGAIGANTSPGGNGGQGYACNITGTMVEYAGGGGGSGNSSERAGDGFAGGGRGAGTTSYYAFNSYPVGVNSITKGSGTPDAIANTGGGGGAGSYWASNGGWSNGSGAGGSGIVILRYCTPPVISINATATTICDGTIVSLSGVGNAHKYIWSDGITNGVGFIPALTNTYTVTGTDTLTGCYDTAKVTVKVHPIDSTNNPQTICANSFYSLNGHNYNTAGKYRDTLQSVNTGCDSIIITVLSVNPVQIIHNPQTICANSFYSFNGHIYTTAGNYNDTFQSVITGCDSIIVTKLTVNPVDTTNNPQTICANSFYSFNGHIYTTAGNYNDTFQSVITGCDSIIITKLTVNPVDTTNNPQTICENSFYSFNGHNYTIAGKYYDTLQSAFGCDSIIETILNVNPIDTNYTSSSICSGSSYTFFDTSLSTAGIYYHTLVKSLTGCDSTIALSLTVDSINLSLKVSYDTIVSNQINATSYQWLDCDNSYSPISNETNQIFVATKSGNYAVFVMNGACSDTSECQNIIVTGINQLNTYQQINLYPNPATNDITISNITSKTTLRLYNTIGKVVAVKEAVSNTTLDISNFNPGVYTLIAFDGKGKALVIKKVIITK